jgi:hypothetical protein
LFHKNVLFLLLLSSHLLGEVESFNKILHEHQINIESKSIKSWIRIFNSQEKVLEHGFTLTETQRYTVLKGLKHIQNKAENKYARRLR